MSIALVNDNKASFSGSSKKGRDFIDISDLDKSELLKILSDAKELKRARNDDENTDILKGKQLIMIFEKNSTRTRTSFEIGINHLGGSGIFLSGKDSQIGRGEPIEDTAGVLSRYADLIMIRTYDHKTLTDLSDHASIPVINGLTDYSHPCQIMADLQTIEEHLGSIENKTVTWCGDVNNVLTSWIHAAQKLKFKLNIATPFFVEENISKDTNIAVFDDIHEAVKNSDVITTDTWVSMGDADSKEKLEALKKFQVNSKLMDSANSDAIFLHCLPAHRGEEVTTEVIDGDKSVIYDEAENRLHAQKAIMLYCVGKQL